MAKLDYHISEKLAEMMNTLAKKEHLERMITADEVRELSPDNTYDRSEEHTSELQSLA